VDVKQDDGFSEWKKIAQIISDHLDFVKDVPGYEIKCIKKRDVVGRFLADDGKPGRREYLHDFVMFDSQLVVEIVQTDSLWGEDFLNTYGLVYIKPIHGKKDWIDKFSTYFESFWTSSLTLEKMKEKLKEGI